MTTPRSASRPTGPAASAGRLLLRGAGRLELDDGSGIDLEPKDALLLAYLAVEGATPRGRLAGLLWPDVDDERARGNLRQRLLRLKRTVGIELVVGGPRAELANGVTHDLDGAHELLQTMDLQQAGGLADWLEAQRDRRRRAHVEALAAAAAQAETAGDLGAALEHAHALVELDPLSEHAHRRVMRLHYLRGDSAAAQAAYERCRQLLEREIGAAPSKETEALRSSLARAASPGLGLPALGPVPISVLRPPRLIGRDVEWSAMQLAWDHGRAAVVLGEAGMGKTRLVTDFARAHGQVVIVAARPGDERVVYALAARLLRQLLRDSIGGLDPALRKELARLLPEYGDAGAIRSDAERARFFNAVSAAIVAAAGGLSGVVIDDLHFADDASLELIQYACADGPLHWVFAGRTAELGRQAKALVEALLGGVITQAVDLAPLTEPQMVDLIDSLGIDGLDARQMAPVVMRQTGGNPLFALETIKAWLVQRPGGSEPRLPVAANVGAIVERRIGRLSQEAIRLARCAAVAGQDFSPDLAAHVLGVRPLDLADAWGELEAAQVFRDGAFAHDLIYEAALRSVPPPIARELHRELATFLHGRAVAAARIADHWLAAEQWQAAGRELMRAAQDAGRSRRWREQAGLLEQAVRCFERVEDLGARFEALLARVEALIYSDLGDETLACARAAEAAAVDASQRLRAMLALLQVLAHRGDLAEAIDVGRRGIALARGQADEATEVRIALPLSGCLCDMQRAPEALALLEPLRERIESRSSPPERCEYFIALGMVLDQSSRLVEAIGAFETACRIARDEALTAPLSEALSNLASTQAKVGRVPRAVELGRQAVQLMSGEEPLSGRPLHSQVMLAHRLRDLGHFDEALPLFESALAAFHAGGSSFWWSATAHRLALAYLQLGQPARAARLLSNEPEAQAPRHRAMWAIVRGELAKSLAGGRRAEAEGHVRKALDILGGNTEDGAFRIATLFATAIVSPDEGEAMATSLAAWANARERFGTALAAHVRAAACALEQHAAGRALPHVEAALRLAPEYVADSHYRAELWLTAYRVFEALARGREAAPLLRDGCSWVQGIARDHVPEEFRDSFLNRNPVNRELLTLATRVK